jgi:hypothetical protein
MKRVLSSSRAMPWTPGRRPGPFDSSRGRVHQFGLRTGSIQARGLDLLALFANFSTSSDYVQAPSLSFYQFTPGQGPGPQVEDLDPSTLLVDVYTSSGYVQAPPLSFRQFTPGTKGTKIKSQTPNPKSQRIITGNLYLLRTRNSRPKTYGVGGVCSGLKARNHGEIYSFHGAHGAGQRSDTSAPPTFAGPLVQGLRWALQSPCEIQPGGGGMARYLPPWAGWDPGKDPRHGRGRNHPSQFWRARVLPSLYYVHRKDAEGAETAQRFLPNRRWTQMHADSSSFV